MILCGSLLVRLLSHSLTISVKLRCLLNAQTPASLHGGHPWSIAVYATCQSSNHPPIIPRSKHVKTGSFEALPCVPVAEQTGLNQKTWDSSEMVPGADEDGTCS